MTPTRSSSGWERRIGDISINVRFLGDPAIYRATMFDRWNENLDLSALTVEDARLASSVAIAFGVSSPVTLERPYAAEVIGQGGHRLEDPRRARDSVDGPQESGSVPRLNLVNSGGALIDVTRNVLVGMVTQTSRAGGQAVSAENIISELEHWGLAHHLRKADVSTQMVRISSGLFRMGAPAPGKPSPAKDVYLNSYFIDQFEVTAADFNQLVSTAH